MMFITKAFFFYIGAITAAIVLAVATYLYSNHLEFKEYQQPYVPLCKNPCGYYDLDAVMCNEDPTICKINKNQTPVKVRA